jgi:hypothetical protein
MALLTAGGGSAQAPAEEAAEPSADAGGSAEVTAPSAPAEAGAKTRALRVAVADLQLAEVEENVGRVFTDSLLAELRKLERLSVISMDEVRAMLDLEAQKQLVGCDEEESCLAEIAGALGADVLIIGGLARVGDQSVLSLKRIDQQRARVVEQVSQRLQPARGEEFLAAVGPAVETLFPTHPLRPGRERGVGDEAALRLNPPPLPTWAFWTTTGVAAGSLVATGLAGGWWAFNQVAYTEMAAGSVDLVVDGADLKARENLVLGAEVLLWSLVGTTAGVALTAAAMTPFVDWRGVAEQE